MSTHSSTVMHYTRFNPTVSGCADLGILHVGHLYMVLVNAHMAHASGGRFLVRFDDNQICWRREVGEPGLRANSYTIRKELEWFGVQVDAWSSQAETERSAQQFIHRKWPCLREPAQYERVPFLVREDSPQYPYAPYLTAEVALYDAWAGINLLIVGDELMSRYALYCWMSEQLGLPLIQHVYLPRLRDKPGANGELDIIAKTVGNHKLKTYRDRGMTPQDIEYLLRQSCLVDPAGEWDYRNVKPQPRLI